MHETASKDTHLFVPLLLRVFEALDSALLVFSKALTLHEQLLSPRLNLGHVLRGYTQRDRDGLPNEPRTNK